MKSGLVSKLKETEAKLQKIGDGPVFARDSDRSRACLQLLSRFGQALRQISEGDYRDSMTQTDVDLRIKFHLDGLFEQSKLNLTKSIPDFDSQEYTDYLHSILSELRGRELPGFLSARLLLTAVSCSIEEWRKELEDTFSKAVDVYVRAARKLIFLIARQYPRLCSIVESVVETACAKQFNEILKRTNELFETGGLEAISTDRDLIFALNKLRFERFEAALRDSIDCCAPTTKGLTPKEHLKAHMKEMMGHHYMHMHSIGYGPSVCLDDAKAALRAYWQLAEQRFHSNATASIEQVLLMKGSQYIERILLELVNNQWSSGIGGLSENSDYCGYGDLSLVEVMEEDTAIAKERKSLSDAKRRYEKELNLLGH